MNTSELLSINVIPEKVAKSVFLKSEQGISHTPYKDEIRLLSCIKQGDSSRLLQEIIPFVQNGIFVGEMSQNDVMQYKYMAVSSITLATRYAIQGGLDEHTAYNFSDEFIRKVDALNEPSKIMEHIAAKILELTNMVKKNRERVKHSPYIRKTINYINDNINKRITVGELAKDCGISADYLSHLFKREMGENLTSYILRQKLEISKTLLWEGYDNSKICYALSFCSQSHFISSFKKQYGITPTEFLAQNR